MSTQRLPPDYQPPPPPDTNTRSLGPLRKYTRRRYMFFHLFFTLRLIGRCLTDPRVPGASKTLFVGITGMLLFALLVPEAGTDMLALVLPIVGPIFDLFGIPFEGAVDWTVFVLAAGSLVRLFPADVLQQHILELKGGWLAPPDPRYPGRR